VAGTWLRHETAKLAFGRFLAPSEYLAERLRANGFEDVECLPYMVDAAALGAPAEDRPAAGAAQRDPRRLLFAGRLVPEKGVRHLIEAMAAVRERVPDARLSIVGDGPEREALAARVAALGLAGVVTFEGHVPHAEMRRFFRTAAAQVLPSIWCENSPVACYESYAFSLPMVASRIGGIPALVVEGETGLLAAPRDPADLARRLVELLEDAALRARLAQGCRAALARYSPAAHLARIENVYSACLARGARAAPGRPDPDLLAVLDALVRQVGAVERWGLSLEAHARGLAAPEPSGEPAREPLQRIGRHLVRILQKKLR
jgi:glycosyltransferase involved in cell wall biosynthesis